MIDFDKIRYLAAIHALTPEACAERLEKGLPLTMVPSGLPGDWDDTQPLVGPGGRWHMIEKLPDDYMG